MSSIRIYYCDTWDEVSHITLVLIKLNPDADILFHRQDDGSYKIEVHT